jgi:hypothetical protein
MGMIFLQGFLYPTSESELNTDNHNLYLDDSTNEFVGINETTGAEVFRIPSGGGSVQPLTYKVLLTQSGTNAPTKTVLINTLDADIPFTYEATGIFPFDMDAIYVAGKTVVTVGNGTTDEGQGTNISLYNSNGAENPPTKIVVDHGGVLSNNYLIETVFTIEVYP